jgi:transposase
MRIMTKHYPVEQRERAVKMVLDHLDEYRSVYAACQAIGPKVPNWSPSKRPVVTRGSVIDWGGPSASIPVSRTSIRAVQKPYLG